MVAPSLRSRDKRISYEDFSQRESFCSNFQRWIRAPYLRHSASQDVPSFQASVGLDDPMDVLQKAFQNANREYLWPLKSGVLWPPIRVFLKSHGWKNHQEIVISHTIHVFWPNGIIFHQPRLPSNQGISLPKRYLLGEVVWGRYNLTNVWYIYLHELLILMVNLGKYTSPMDSMGFGFAQVLRWLWANTYPKKSN